MTVRDVLLVLGAVPLLGVVALRLAAEMGLAAAVPAPEALPAALSAFGVVFLVYVALTLRSIAHATWEILARDADASASAAESVKRKAAVSDFAIHLDRSAELDLRGADPDAAADAEPEPEPAPPSSAAPRKELFGEVSDLLTRIPSSRPR